MSLDERKQRQDAAIPHLLQKFDAFKSREPDFDLVPEDDKEPDEYDDLDSNDERNIVLTEKNYPFREFTFSSDREAYDQQNGTAAGHGGAETVDVMEGLDSAASPGTFDAASISRSITNVRRV
jgi:hypothetical protein